MNQPQPHQSVPSQRPGRMTTVMRAVAATGPKVLRIGVVHGGRVSEERIIKQRTDVTVGPSEKNMFVVGGNNLPPTFRLFELSGQDYHLNFLEEMSGRVALPSGISDLTLLKGQARRTSDRAYQVRLTDESRGKIVIGETTFLFQFVAPPPVQPRPQLPVAVLRGASAIDWNTTIIAALSFLLHFLALGAVYSDFLDPVVDDEMSVAGLIDSLKNLPAPPPLEEQPPEKAPESAAKTEARDEPKRTPANTPKPTSSPPNAKQVAAISNELDRMEMATLGALGSSGPATAGVLRGGEVPTSALDQAAASNAGVGIGTGDLKLGSGGGALRPGSVGGGLASIGSTGRGSEGTGAAQKVAGPKGNAEVGGTDVSGGTVSNAARVVAGMRAGFRACYQRGLNENPDAHGSIRLSIRVGPSGEVASVVATPTGNLPASVVACVEARAQAAQFDPPEGGSAVIQVPVTFVKQ